jgi:erythrocyte band 7 integral membrane protein
MSNLDVNGVNGKAPLDAASNSGSQSGRADGPIVKVQPPRREDLQPSYARVIKPDTEDESQHGWYGSKFERTIPTASYQHLTSPPGMINTLGGCIGTLGAIPCCIICPNPYKPVAQGQVGLITKFGRFSRAVDPGLVKVNPLSESLIQVDVKIQIVEVPKQVCMTKDNVNLTLTSVIYYHITSPHKAAFGISNLRQALVERTQTTLRHVIGARVLQDVIERREEIAQSIREIIEETAAGWGAAVESMLIKDIIFSQELQDSLSMAAQSKRTGEAKVISARAGKLQITRTRIRIKSSFANPSLQRSNPQNSCVKPPTSCPAHPPCKFDISKRCRQWPRRPIAKSYSYPRRTRLCSNSLQRPIVTVKDPARTSSMTPTPPSLVMATFRASRMR